MNGKGSAGAALVTGAGRGIGRHIALHLARAGYAVGITARSPDQLDETARIIEAEGGRTAAEAGDVTDPAGVDRVCRAVADQLGPVDILVNNAAYAGPLQPFWETSDEQWRQAMTTNVLGPVYFLREVLPAMMRRGHGYVVNMNSMQGSDPAGSPLPYGVSKAALMRLTDGLASQLAGSGVKIFDVSPGLVRTTLTAGRPDLDALPESAWAPPEAAARQVVALVSGKYDGLHGRFIRAADDLDLLCARLREDPEARLLRLTSRAIAAG
jgi:NAD(P)-dependent dehydrogenase (short-subunit alcohol dehydrogenase family)